VVQLDTVLLRELGGASSESAVGIYQAAVRLFLIPMLLPEIILKVFLPQLSRMHGRDGEGLVRDLGRVNHILLTMGLVIGLVTIYRGNDIIHIIYGDRYTDAGPILQLLGVTIMMRFGAAYNLYFTIRNRVWFRVWSAVLALTAVVVFDLILIPRYGAIGAAYASILSNAVYWIPYLVALYIAEGTMNLGWNLLRAGIVAGTAVFALHITASIDVRIMLPTYFFLGLLAVFLTMPPDDRRRIITQFHFRGA
jgi:O-antigen/teichoic acid export membrane protein